VPEFQLGERWVGDDHPPLVIAEVGINHEGSVDLALAMVDAAAARGAECVKIQSHILDDEMIPNEVVPGNADVSIWEIMERCRLTADEERQVKARVLDHGMLFLSTPFSRAAADRLEALGVPGYKIGSGECNNYPLVEHIAGFGKPIILSTGMNDIDSVRPSVEIFRKAGVPFALLHCTSMYPTPYDRVRLGALGDLRAAFPDAVLGLSDHSLSNYPCLGAVPLGARILERHFTCDMALPGPDIEVSMDPDALEALIEGSRAIYQSLGGSKSILEEEKPTIDFAYACVVTIAPIAPGEALSRENLWVKRPGDGEILAKDFDGLLGRRAQRAIGTDQQLRWDDVE
jgi:N-acetylneuraminate synthase